MKINLLCRLLLTVSLLVSCQLILFSQLEIEWKKKIDKGNWELGKKIIPTQDNGYIFCGTSSNNKIYTAWIIKIDSIGNVEWENSFEGYTTGILESDEGDYIVCGVILTQSNIRGHNDCIILNYSSDGNLLWQKIFGGSKHDLGQSITLSEDGGYVVAGFSRSKDGDVAKNNGQYDSWIFKVNSFGNIVWSRVFGGSGDDRSYQIISTSDYGFLICGQSSSNNFDVNSNYGGDDSWVIKLDALGNLEWERNYGGSKNDAAFSLYETKKGKYIVSGYSWSDDFDLNVNHGILDAFAFKIDIDGNVKWSQSFGGSSSEVVDCITQTLDNKIILAISSSSDDHDFIGGTGNTDIWIKKLKNNGKQIWSKNYSDSNVEFIDFLHQNEDGSFIALGSSGITSPDSDFYIIKFYSPYDKESNWARKYMKYIIGKIILVITGTLVALQINR